jgi:hypothetical protein
VAYPPLYGHGFLYLGFAFPFSSVFFLKEKNMKREVERKTVLP